MKIPEFIDTYSDDLAYLIDSREVLLTHPFRTEIRKLCDASFCRLITVFMVGSIEVMLEHWKEKDKLGVLNAYFKKNTSNGDRVLSLYEAFRKTEIDVDKEIFKDYLAIKYLRNTIVHSKWRQQEKNWMKSRGFPTDVRKLTGKHWNKILKVNDSLMMYIALTENPELLDIASKNKIVGIRENGEEELTPLIISRRNLPDVLWMNFDNIHSKIWESIEKVVTSEKYSKLLAQSTEGSTKLSFFLTAKKASEDGVEELSEHKQLMSDVLFLWELYRELTFSDRKIDQELIDKNLGILMELHRRNSYFNSFFPWDENWPEEIKLRFVTHFIEDRNGLSEIEIMKSLDMGKIINSFLPSILLVSIFIIYFPLIDVENARSQRDERTFIWSAWKLREAWYSYIERHKPPDDEQWPIYEELFERLIE
jgi:hypothetical protein